MNHQFAILSLALLLTSLFLFKEDIVQKIAQKNEVIEVQIEDISDDLMFIIDPPENFVTDYEDNEFLGLPQVAQSSGLKEYQGACIGGKDPSQLSADEIYLQFLKGPCSPIVMVPGWTASQLSIQIDCETLMREQPAVFKGCGWKSCKSLLHSPKSEYVIWVTGAFSPISLYQFKRTATCFGDLFSFDRNFNNPDPQLTYSSKKGLKIVTYGHTEKTKKDSNCGTKAVMQMPLFETLDLMGYQTGVTYQYVPYDWRINVYAGETQVTIPQSIKALYKNTQQKVVLVGHSFGTIQTLFSLTTAMTQAEKDEMVHLWMPAGSVITGLPNISSNMGGGDGFLVKIFKNFRIGLQLYSQIALLTHTTRFDFYPQNLNEKYKNEIWMNEIMKRRAYEQDPLSFPEDQIPYDFFPRATSFSNCGVYEKTRPLGNCNNDIHDWTQEFIFKIKNDVFYGTQSDILRSFEYQINGTYYRNIYANETLQAEHVHNLTNPGVKTVIFYMTAAPTMTSFVMDKDPRVEIEQTNQIYTPEIVNYGSGDGTVLSENSIVPGLKWIWEHNQGLPNTHPIRFVDNCSWEKLIPPTGLYDTVGPDGYPAFSQSGYNGFACECPPKTSLKKCLHSAYVQQPSFNQLIISLAQTNKPSPLASETMKGQRLTKDQIINIQKQCPNLDKGY